MSTLRHSRRARRAPRRAPATPAACIACCSEHSFEHARLDARQISRDGQRIHCAQCAELHVIILDDRVLYWPACGHADGDAVVLYDRTVCVTCED